MAAPITLPSYEDLQALLHAALAKVNELEEQLKARPTIAAVPPRKRAPRRPVTDACQYCGDVKTDKVLFLGLPMCKGDNYEWTKCASRMRRAKGVPGYAWDRRYSVTQPPGDKDAPWAIRFNGELLGINPDRGAARRLAYDHRVAALAEAA